MEVPDFPTRRGDFIINSFLKISRRRNSRKGPSPPTEEFRLVE
jgi:hypothetical protein